MNTSLKAFAVFIALAGSAWAEDLQDLPDDTLLGEVVTATENGEKERLLELMREVQARGLLMFRPSDTICDVTISKVGLLENMLAFGNARQAYITAARMTAVEEGDCGCPFELLDFETFLLSQTGVSVQKINQNDLQVLRAFRRVHQSQADADYRRFRADICGRP